MKWGDVMATNLIKGKHRIQVSLTESEYQLLRRMAFEKECTVNELMRIVTVSVAKEFLVSG